MRTVPLLSSLLQRCINAMNKSWHPDHFFCSLCGKQFEEDNFNFYEKDGKPYCKEDYFDQFAPTCRRCDRAIMGAYLSAVGGYWHQECFTCKVSGGLGAALLGWGLHSQGWGLHSQGWGLHSQGWGLHS